MVRARVSEKRRERSRKIGGLVLILTCVGLFAALLFGGLRFAVRTCFTRNDRYAVRSIEISNPGGKLQDRHIREYAKIRTGENLFAVDLKSVLNNLESAPLVRNVSIRRDLPDAIRIDVVERTPIARFDRYWAVDVEGYVLGPSTRAPHLPVIAGYRRPGMKPGSLIRDDGFQMALRLLDLCASTRVGQYVRIERIDISQPEILDLYLATGERAVLPRHDLKLKLNKLAAMVRRSRDEGRELQSFDLTGDANAVGV